MVNPSSACLVVPSLPPVSIIISHFFKHPIVSCESCVAAKTTALTVRNVGRRARVPATRDCGVHTNHDWWGEQGLRINPPNPTLCGRRSGFCWPISSWPHSDPNFVTTVLVLDESDTNCNESSAAARLHGWGTAGKIKSEIICCGNRGSMVVSGLSARSHDAQTTHKQPQPVFSP